MSVPVDASSCELTTKLGRCDGMITALFNEGKRHLAKLPKLSAIAFELLFPLLNKSRKLRVVSYRLEISIACDERVRRKNIGRRVSQPSHSLGRVPGPGIDARGIIGVMMIAAVLFHRREKFGCRGLSLSVTFPPIQIRCRRFVGRHRISKPVYHFGAFARSQLKASSRAEKNFTRTPCEAATAS